MKKLKSITVFILVFALVLMSFGASASDASSGSAIAKEDIWCVNQGAEIFLGETDANICGTMYYPAGFDGSKTYPIVIASHGFLASSAFFSMLWGEKLANAGYLVYAIDFCGGNLADGGPFGMITRSDGDWLEMSVLTEADDLNAVIDFIKTLDYVDQDKIFLFGQSQGGLVSALVAAEREEKGLNDLAGIVLLYPYFNIADDVREKYPTEADLPAESDAWLQDTQTGARYFRDAYTLNVYEKIAGFSGNVLILQGVADTTVPYNAAVKALTESYANQNAALVLIAGAQSEHAFDLPFTGFVGTDTAVSAMIDALSNWQVWNAVE